MARVSRRQCTTSTSEIGVTDFMFRADQAGAKGAFETGFEPEISLAVLPNTQSELPFG